jgi:hypothetical protein
VEPDRRLIACFAPGAGLGHMNRAMALCLRLRDEGADARIVTDSPFAEGLAAMARVPVVKLARATWADDARAWAEAMRPRLIITDTFPYGIRDEWRGAPPAASLVHVARRLREPFPMDPRDFALIVRAEPLSEAHGAALGGGLELPGPIRLAPGRIATRVPRELDRDGLTLVVHSGPPEEVDALVALAESPFALIAPAGGIDYYPATNLYARARRVITGAGYNSMADLLPWRGKHTALPFPRRYDDQAARLAAFFRDDADGSPAAAAAILRLL